MIVEPDFHRGRPLFRYNLRNGVFVESLTWNRCRRTWSVSQTLPLWHNVYCGVRNCVCHVNFNLIIVVFLVTFNQLLFWPEATSSMTRFSATHVVLINHLFSAKLPRSLKAWIQCSGWLVIFYFRKAVCLRINWRSAVLNEVLKPLRHWLTLRLIQARDLVWSVR